MYLSPFHPSLRLRSLVVHQFRNVKPGTSLRFGDGFHIVLGKNATGKSTLLQLIAAVSGSNFHEFFFDETPLHIEASFTLGRLSIEIEIQRKFEPAPVSTHGDRDDDFVPDEELNLIFRVEQRQARFCKWIQIKTGEDVRFYADDPRKPGVTAESSKFIPTIGPLYWPISAVILDATTIIQNGEYCQHPGVREELDWIIRHQGTRTLFDESLGTLNGLVDGRFFVIRTEGFRPPCRWLPKALDFDATGEPVTLELSNDPLLATVIEKLGLDNATVHFEKIEKTNLGWEYSSPSFQFFRGAEAVRRHDQLSFGEQRLFSFAWYLACNLDIVAADELVNGLHPEWIDWCVGILRDRQSFLTSQNPILVDSLPLASKEDIRHGIIVCESMPGEGGTNRLIWRQLDDHEASSISRALEQSPSKMLSDLLHALKLW